MAKVVKENKADIIHRLAVENVVIPLLKLMKELGYAEYSNKERVFVMSQLEHVVNGKSKISFFEEESSPRGNRRSINSDRNFMLQIDHMKVATQELREFHLELDAKIKELEEIPMILTRKVLFEKAK